jgi:hypothetical protein
MFWRVCFVFKLEALLIYFSCCSLVKFTPGLNCLGNFTDKQKSRTDQQSKKIDFVNEVLTDYKCQLFKTSNLHSFEKFNWHDILYCAYYLTIYAIQLCTAFMFTIMVYTQWWINENIHIKWTPGCCNVFHPHIDVLDYENLPFLICFHYL